MRDGRVFVADGNLYFNRSGPLLFDTPDILAEILHPDQFPPAHGGTVWRRYGQVACDHEPKTWQTPSAQDWPTSVQSSWPVHVCAHTVSVSMHPPATPHCRHTCFATVPAGQNGGRGSPSPGPQLPPVTTSNNATSAARIIRMSATLPAVLTRRK